MTEKHKPAIFEDIDDEHKEMRTMLGNVHAILKSRSESVENVRKALERVCSYLEAHFHKEDKGGFFAEITSQAPRLSDRAEQVSHEHEGLLASFAKFAQHAGMGDGGSQWWEQLDTEFHNVSKQLMEHEHREQDLLQQAFNEDIGSGD